MRYFVLMFVALFLFGCSGRMPKVTIESDPSPTVVAVPSGSSVIK